MLIMLIHIKNNHMINYITGFIKLILVILILVLLMIYILI